jgi:ribosomal protein L32
MGRAEYMRQWRKTMRFRQKCPNCGEESVGHYYCQECRDKKKPYNQEYSSSYNSGYWAANKDWINAGRRRRYAGNKVPGMG